MRYEEFSNQILNFDKNYGHNITPKQFFGFPIEPILKSEDALQSPAQNIAYFSMEFGLAPSIYNSFQLSNPSSDKNQFYIHEVFSNQWLCDYLFKIKIDKMLDIPIYSGGLGVLAGDAMKSCADLHYPVVGIGILWNKGYFKQKFWYKHGQIPQELTWDPHAYPGLIPLKTIIKLDTKEGPLHLRIWKYYVYSFDKTHACPLLLLDSNLEENPPAFRKLTDQLYRSDNAWWKIYQRIILGIGGMKALLALNYKIDCYHLNEGHAAFALIEKYVTLQNKDDFQQQKKKFAYTCHTPVAAGHDRFRTEDIDKILTAEYVEPAAKFGKEDDKSDMINLTFLCLSHCSKINAVAQKHGEIMRLQFPHYAENIQSITNGVHLHTWLSESFQKLFDKYSNTFGDWRYKPEQLAKVKELAGDANFRRDIFEAHMQNKRQLLKVISRWRLDENILTLCWARRIAGYKRPALIFHQVERIVDIARRVGPLQIILAGKAHPNDNIGGAHIDEILDHIDQLNPYKDIVKVLILENYDTYFGKLLTNSVDVWLNNPLPPFEASGTSGMKAILNGVTQLTTLDGWVVEAEKDNIGWIFGYEHHGPEIGNEKELRLDEDSNALYNALENVAKLYYQTNQKGKVDYQSAWIDKMINCVHRGAFFNTHRMMQQYYEEMWANKNISCANT
jgi:starch phosphorylase